MIRDEYTEVKKINNFVTQVTSNQALYSKKNLMISVDKIKQEVQVIQTVQHPYILPLK